MVDANMFKDAFAFPKKAAPAPQQPKMIPNPNYVAQPPPVNPVAPAPAPVYEDPEIAKLKFFFLKWLSILIGGAAILLIVWRIFLKFL